jgi:hypothetical protein
MESVTPSADAAARKAFHLDKTCASDLLCTIASSDFDAMPAGTEITYMESDPSIGLAYPTIVIAGGTTTGVCDWNQPPGAVLAKCTFQTGTGELSRFNLVVDVTVTGDPASPDAIWHWDGTYSLG